MSAKAIIIAGYGLNCEEESQVALNYVGMDADIIHVKYLIDNPRLLKTAELLLILGVV